MDWSTAGLVSNSLTNPRLGLPNIASESPMLVVCPDCATSYDVDIASPRAGPWQVRCPRCQAICHAELPQATKLLAAAHALAPVRRAIEAVALTIAEESALVLEVGAPAESMTDPILEPTAADPEGQMGTAMPEMACDEAPWDAPADLPGIKADDPIFALPAQKPFAASQPAAPADIALAALFQRLEAQQVEAEAAPETFAAESRDAEEMLAAQNDAAGDELVAGLATLVAERARQRRGGWRLPVSRLLLVILGLLIVDAVIVGRRVDLVRVMPQTAAFYARLGLPVNLRGVDFDGVGALAEEHGNSSVLVVTGDVLNGTADVQDVPQLRLALRNAAHEEIYSWTVAPARMTLPAGEALTFRSQLPAPPLDTQEVLVSFVDRADSHR
jgi:predicted Zn finger-like uncharacterized protein